MTVVIVVVGIFLQVVLYAEPLLTAGWLATHCRGSLSSGS